MKNTASASRQMCKIACILVLALAIGSKADSTSPVSGRSPSIPSSAGGNGDSVAPWMSLDGRYILFSSSANNLTSGDNGQFGLDVFLRDRVSNTTVLVSANYQGTGGGNGSSVAAMLSANGRYAVFQSDSNDLVPGDTNEASDIFVRDLQTGTNILVSVATDGGFGNGKSTVPVMTSDGRFVAFLSTATNLVIGDTNGIQDVFVRDLVSQTTTLVSVGASGANSIMDTPVITPDGQRIAFFSTAKGLVSSVPATSTGEIYVRDLQSNTTIWASTNAAAVAAIVLFQTGLQSYHPAMSTNGNFVTFKTGTNTSPSLLFRYDIAANTTIGISSNAQPSAYSVSANIPEDHIYGPEISPDGRFVVYSATNKTPISSTSVQLWDAQSGTNTVVSVASSGLTATNISSSPFVSSDGRFVVFMSSATNLVSNVVSNGFHIYLRDLQNGITQLIDADTNGVGSIDNSGAALAMSADGQLIAFDSSDGGMVGNDNNGALDVFLRNVPDGTNELVSCRDSSVVLATGSGMSFIGPISLSDDGTWAAFSSYANDLTPNDTNRALDVFARNLVAGTNVLVSADVNGNAALGGPSLSPVISQNGRFVAFISLATNLTTGQNNSFKNIFLRDLLSNSNILVSVSSDTSMRLVVESTETDPFAEPLMAFSTRFAPDRLMSLNDGAAPAGMLMLPLASN